MLQGGWSVAQGHTSIQTASPYPLSSSGALSHSSHRALRPRMVMLPAIGEPSVHCFLEPLTAVFSVASSLGSFLESQNLWALTRLASSARAGPQLALLRSWRAADGSDNMWLLPQLLGRKQGSRKQCPHHSGGGHVLGGQTYESPGIMLGESSHLQNEHNDSSSLWGCSGHAVTSRGHHAWHSACSAVGVHEVWWLLPLVLRSVPSRRCAVYLASDLNQGATASPYTHDDPSFTGSLLFRVISCLFQWDGSVLEAGDSISRTVLILI